MKTKDKNQFTPGLLTGMLLGVFGTILYQQKKDDQQIQFLRHKLADLLRSDFDLEKFFHPVPPTHKPKTLSTKKTTPSSS